MLKFSALPVRVLLTAGILLVFAASGRAEQTPERNYQLTDDASEVLSKSKPLLEAKNYDEVIRLIDAQLAKTADQNSYDYAILTEYKAQAYLLKGDYTDALVPMVRGLEISDAHTPTYSDERTTRDLSYFIAQIYFQEGAATKSGKVNVDYLMKAEKYMERWIKLVKTPTPEGLLFYASLLYTHAMLDSEHPDKALLQRTLDITEQGLHMSAHPREEFYRLKLGCLLASTRNEEAAEILEILLAQKPDNKTYWQQLASIYLTTKQDVRAITAIERAQAHGFMNSPKENYTLVGIHFNLQQYGVAAELLDKGLHNGSIEDDEKNWLLLASAYQQMHRDFKAIDTLVEATKHFPKSGQLEYLIAQNYYALDKQPEALKHIQLCVDKGGGNKPAQAYLFLAYIAFELKKLDVALEATNHAMTFGESSDRAGRMKKAIEAAIAEREEKKKKA
jgi:tetratricopeptide (TPR) repeat protein